MGWWRVAVAGKSLGKGTFEFHPQAHVPVMQGFSPRCVTAHDDLVSHDPVDLPPEPCGISASLELAYGLVTISTKPSAQRWSRPPHLWLHSATSGFAAGLEFVLLGYIVAEPSIQ